MTNLEKLLIMTLASIFKREVNNEAVPDFNFGAVAYLLTDLGYATFLKEEGTIVLDNPKIDKLLEDLKKHPYSDIIAKHKLIVSLGG